MSRYTVFLVALILPVSAVTAAGDRAKFTDMATNLASVLGAADYCGNEGQPLADAFSRGLELFELRPMDIQAVLATLESQRRQVRARTAEALAGHACPADVREKVRQAMQDLETAWYRAVQADTGVDPKRTARAVAPGSAPTAAPAPASAPTPIPSSTVSPGKYSCYTFDAGQLNYAYTDVLIHDANRYSVGSKSGSYRLAADGSMTFTGTLSNAVGKYAVKNTGKPQIDLIFNGDSRASMACPKT